MDEQIKVMWMPKAGAMAFPENEEAVATVEAAKV
jgi:hypothetical protein